MRTIERYFTVIDRTLCTIDGALSYDRLTDAVIKLCEALNNTETNEFIWSDVGEFGAATLGDLVVGAYWHYSEYHSGQNSLSYAALSALGGIFSPGYSDGPEAETGEQFIYEQLAQMVDAQ